MYGGWLCILHTGKDMHIANFRILNVISNRIGVLLQITAGSVRETPILQFYLSRPASLVLIILIIVTVVVPAVQGIVKAVRKSKG